MTITLRPLVGPGRAVPNPWGAAQDVRNDFKAPWNEAVEVNRHLAEVRSAMVTKDLAFRALPRPAAERAGLS